MAGVVENPGREMSFGHRMLGTYLCAKQLIFVRSNLSLCEAHGFAGVFYNPGTSPRHKLNPADRFLPSPAKVFDRHDDAFGLSHNKQPA